MASLPLSGLAESGGQRRPLALLMEGHAAIAVVKERTLDWIGVLFAVAVRSEEPSVADAPLMILDGAPRELVTRLPLRGLTKEETAQVIDAVAGARIDAGRGYERKEHESEVAETSAVELGHGADSTRKRAGVP